MLRPVQMRQISIILPKEQLHNFLAYAGQENLLHITDAPEKAYPEGVDRFDVTSILARTSAIRNRLLSLSSILEEKDGPVDKIDAPVQNVELLAGYLDKETAELEHSIKATEESLEKLQIEKERTQKLARFLAGLESAGVPLKAIGGGGFLAMVAGEIGHESLSEVKRTLDETTYGNTVFAITGSTDKAQTFLAVFPAPFQEEALQSITSIGAKLEPSWADLPAETSVALEAVDSRLEQIDQSVKQANHDRDARTEALAPRIRGLNLLAEILESRARGLYGSSTTHSTSILRAWVPQDQIAYFTDGALKACDGLVSVHEEPKIVQHATHIDSQMAREHSTSEEASPPTLVRVPGWAGPLQSVINNFGVPSYNETNPLLFMVASYPIIYGLMFGDFGEGPIFILMGLLMLRLKRKKAKVWDIFQPIINGAELVILLGIGITAFGFVFGDFFGFESLQVFGFSGLFSPTEGALAGDITNLKRFMVFVLYFGVAHFVFGLALGAYNKVRRKEYSEVIFGPVCWAIFYISGVNLVAKFAQANFDASVLVKEPFLLVITFLPVGLMGWKEGGLHAFEAFLSSASNTFSYLRIWALNIADFFFKFALFTSMGLLGAVLGNILVMIIEGLIVFVQTLRLHWVEWFSKFYEGAGVSFAPYREPTGWMAQVSG